QMMQIFICGIQDLPNNVLQSAVLKKYALAERSHHQLLLATWNLEGMKCRVHMLEKIQCRIEETHSQEIRTRRMNCFMAISFLPLLRQQIEMPLNSP
ncbi:hypothetical protein PAXRUDRAFT_142487, partial [Paxillus rubicundulus Ve08.2h10]